MKSFIFLVTVLLALTSCHCQYKNLGIKTRYPAPQPSSGNLVVNNYAEGHNEAHNYYGYGQQETQQQYQPPPQQAQLSPYARYNGNFKPAEYYQGDNAEYVKPEYKPQPVILDATAEFINKTRAGIAPGICYTEVPTASLVRGSGIVPVGNGTKPEMSKIEICCEGYQRNPHVFKRCDPICEDDCPNGICTAPNTCVCIPGHIRNEQNKCITTCPIGCGNGVCDYNNECKCKPGYVLEPKERKFCMPVCENGCEFGKCVAPNQCECQNGYRLTGSGQCEAYCSDCENGKCAGPGLCRCNEGYTRIGQTCEPVCSRGCNQGTCTAPDTCSCGQGMELDHTGTKCIPHCAPACINGVCGDNNQCICNSGYIPSEEQPNLCKPHCPFGCPNGYCSGPNFCTCKPGFIKIDIKGRQSCIPI